MRSYSSWPASFKPRRDQPGAIAQLLDGIESSLAHHQTLLRVTGSGKTFLMANVIATNRPTMILAPNKTLAAQLYGEMKEFFPDNSVEYFVSYYDYYQPEAYVPTTDTFIEKDASINDHRADAAVGHQGTAGAPRRGDRRLGVSHLRSGDPQAYLPA